MLSSSFHRFSLLMSLALLLSCQPKENQGLNNAYHEALAKFRLDLKEERETNWLALSGFYLLEEGEQTVGSDTTSSIQFPSPFPERIMKIIKWGDSVSFEPMMNTDVLVNGIGFSERISVSVKDNIPKTIFTWRNYEWWARRMGEKLGIRLKNKERQQLDENVVDYFPTDPDWIINADFIPVDFNKYTRIQNSIGAEIEMEVAGNALFTYREKEYSLDIFEDSEYDGKYFLIIGDETNGITTYTSGRYAYYEKPVEGKMVLDFNYLYSPPCAFTEYATCPFPPPQNRLDFAIEAGEIIKE